MAEPATELNANDMEAVANTLIVDEAAPEEELHKPSTKRMWRRKLQRKTLSRKKLKRATKRMKQKRLKTPVKLRNCILSRSMDLSRSNFLEDLKRSYSGQAYIQKGMQETAAVKKEAEGVYNALLAERQKTNELLQQLESEGYIPPPVPPDRALFDKDPIGYMGAKADYDEQLQQWGMQQQAIKDAQEAQGALNASGAANTS